MEVLATFAKQNSLLFNPKSIFDTQLMANFCAPLKYNISYISLVENFLNIHLSKELQRSNWALRPLQQKQIQYAIGDVLYLVKIYQILKNKLLNSNKFNWFLEESEVVLKKLKATTNNKAKLYNKFLKHNHNACHLENIKLIALWRDNLAKLHNVPRNFILKDRSLNNIARIKPALIKNLQEIDIESRVSKAKIKKELVKLIQNNISNNQKIHSNFLCNSYYRLMKVLKNNNNITIYNHTNYRMNQDQKDLYDKIKIILLNKSIYYNLSPELIINQNNLKQIILGHKKLKQQLSGWRFIAFGKDLRNLL